MSARIGIGGARIRRRLACERGMTMIEVLIGAVLAVMVVGATALGMVRNSDSAVATQRQAQLIAVLQNRMEYVRQLFRQNYSSGGFAALALSENPQEGKDATLPNNPSDPNDFISPYVPNYNTATSASVEKLLLEKNYNGTSQGTIGEGSEQMQVDTSKGRIAPVVYVDLVSGTTYSSASLVPSGDTYAIVNTYITIAKIAPASGSGNCPTTAGTGSNASDARRVIVAARLPQATAHTNLDGSTPQYATTLLTNPIPSNQCQSSTGLDVGLEIGKP